MLTRLYSVDSEHQDKPLLRAYGSEADCGAECKSCDEMSTKCWRSVIMLHLTNGGACNILSISMEFGFGTKRHTATDTRSSIYTRDLSRLGYSTYVVLKWIT